MHTYYIDHNSGHIRGGLFVHYFSILLYCNSCLRRFHSQTTETAFPSRSPSETMSAVVTAGLSRSCQTDRKAVTLNRDAASSFEAANCC